MFEMEGKHYELKYNLKRIELIESSTGESLMATVQKNRGLLSLQHLKVYFSLGLKEVDTDAFVSPRKGQEYAELLIERDGYEAVDLAVIEALQRDCPFFFQAD